MNAYGMSPALVMASLEEEPRPECCAECENDFEWLDSSAAQTHGYSSAAQTHGYYSAATANGKASAAVAFGPHAKARAAIGCWLTLDEWKDGARIDLKSAKVDGKKIKADTWYALRGGKFVEVSG